LRDAGLRNPRLDVDANPQPSAHGFARVHSGLASEVTRVLRALVLRRVSPAVECSMVIDHPGRAARVVRDAG